jgi:hypothetical protein
MSEMAMIDAGLVCRAPDGVLEKAALDDKKAIRPEG